MTRSTSQPTSPGAAPMDYGTFVVCPSCSVRRDIWTIQCDCGFELLPDDRKVKLRKEAQAPAKRLEHRAERLAASDAVPDQEQAVRDFATLRSECGHRGGTPTMIRLLTTLGRIDEACVEAEAAVSAEPELATLAASALQPALIELSRRCVAMGDSRPESWLRTALDKGKGDIHGRAPLTSALVGMLLAQGRDAEALDAFAATDAQLGAARKKTSKNAFVNTLGNSDAFTVGRYSQATAAMNEHRQRVVEVNAAVAMASGRQILADAARLEQSGDVAAALAAIDHGSGRVIPTIRQLTAIAAELSGADRRLALGDLEGVSSTLEKEHRRLAKASKRAGRRG